MPEPWPTIPHIPRTVEELGWVTQWLVVSIGYSPTRAARIAFAAYWWAARNPDPAQDGAHDEHL